MHEQEHGHSCGCGHDHAPGCGCGDCGGQQTPRIRLTHAEGATAAAVRFSVPGPQGPAELRLAEAIRALAGDIQAAGGLMGHVKAALTGAPEVTTFSCTGGSVSISRRDGSDPCAVDLVAITLGLDDDRLRAILTARLPELSAE